MFRLAKGKFDGVRYSSRHYQTTDFCYAVWESVEDRIVDAGMKNLKDYEDSEWLPPHWEFESITAEELLEDVLRFKIVPL